MGRVSSGIVTFSKFHVFQAWRYGYDAFFSWPMRLVMLKRCFMVQRFLLGHGKELLIINLHNSTFDKKGELRIAELKELGEFLQAEYKKGNYVVAGGDWNMNPRGFEADRITTGDKVHLIEPPVSEDFIPGWKFVYDPSSPTNRDVDKPYTAGVSGTTLIDFYVVSPNVEALAVRTLQLGFENSDHNPVFLKFILK
jgi:exonuclease III